MAKSKKKSKKSAKKPDYTLWIILAGIIVLIAVPVTVNTIRASNLPGERFRSQGNVHVALGTETPAYNSNPPTSGWHTPYLASWGSYDTIQEDQELIHNMEDGGVIIWYQNGTPEENNQQIIELEAIAQGYRRVVIAPRDDMDSPYILTAWQRMQKFDTLDVEGMRHFIDTYEGIDHHNG